MKIDKHIFFAFALLFVMLALLAIIAIELVPLFRDILVNANDEEKIINYIDSYGATGIPVLIGLQMIQVILTFIPAGAIQLLSGLCYGTVYGTIISIVGIILGNAFVFLFVKQFRKTFLVILKKYRKKRGEKHNRFLSINTINKLKHPEYVAFLTSLIPGIPNGVLPYVFANTKVSFIKYILAITFANIPTIFLFTWLGERIARGEYIVVIILTAIAIIIAIIAFVNRNKIIDKIKEATTD